MSPKEKAKELIDKFDSFDLVQYADSISGTMELTNMGFNSAKNCAIVCVDLILSYTPMYKGGINPDWEYWALVKSEIEKYEN